MKKVLLLGSTGSIGVNSLNVIREYPDIFSVSVLTANNNIDILKKQIEEFHPQTVVVVDKEKAEELKRSLKINCNIFSGKEALCQVAANSDYNILLGAVVGFSGLAPTIEAIKRGKRIALANKETLVVAGEFIMNLIKEFNAELLPIDSEHSAIYQCLMGEKKEQVEKLIITASGGPFLNTDQNKFSSITVKEALNHPNWSMGNKITIDSATMMNKGLEVIEARWLFGFLPKKLEVLVHPQSIIHSMVQFIDGSIKAQLGFPDMRLPIQFALTYPNRIENKMERTNMATLKELTFFEPDLIKYKCLKLAYQVLDKGGITPCVLNAANEIAVSRFLKEDIKFSDIPNFVDNALNKFKNIIKPDIETIFEYDRLTRDYVLSL
ncbi:MAG: 1-deoxy-D-xylulose-5-phosphate reductoisomerase [Ignavibacteriales bacterium CG_4_9_14_3_um_filter_30_11]|nr:MAG: 1-deoxy-D-xylulose-5-phosphate reductoisomerase [Ignavibacteriales bacterium CG_4_9_14_3_um_filter_30_11]